MDVEGNSRPNPGTPVNFPGPTSVTIPEQSPSTNYTIPGILHFIKHEWSRFEKERANWEVQKTEIQVRKANCVSSIVSLPIFGGVSLLVLDLTLSKELLLFPIVTWLPTI